METMPLWVIWTKLAVQAALALGAAGWLLRQSERIQNERLRQAVQDAVRWAEQVGRDWTGSARREAVDNALRGRGIAVTPEVDALIEAEVLGLPERSAGCDD